MKELTVPASVEQIETVTDFISEQLEALECPMKTQMQIAVAIDELFGNIAHYAYGSGTGEATVQFCVTDDPLTAVITFLDKGVPFNPLSAEEPDTSLSAEERTVGGLGIYMVKKSMDEVLYEYKDGQNRLTIKKRL